VHLHRELVLDLDNVEELQDTLLQAVVTYDAVPAQRNSYDQKYIIDFLLTRLGKQAIIHSVWIGPGRSRKTYCSSCQRHRGAFRAPPRDYGRQGNDRLYEPPHLH